MYVCMVCMYICLFCLSYLADNRVIEAVSVCIVCYMYVYMYVFGFLFVCFILGVHSSKGSKKTANASKKNKSTDQLYLDVMKTISSTCVMRLT